MSWRQALALAVAVVAPNAIAAPATASTGAGPQCTPPRLNISAARAGGRATVSPAPESRDASPATQISFLLQPGSQLLGVRVTGSRSGPHAGRLVAYSQGDGASFVPHGEFAEGETVRVRAKLSSGGGRPVSFGWTFVVAIRDRAVNVGGSPRPAPHPVYYQHFQSRTDLQPPTVTVTAHAPGTTPGDIFIAPYSGPGQYGPMILDENGALLWFDPLSPAGTRASDFRVQQYNGEAVLTWWQDPLVTGADREAGEMIINSSYEPIAVVRGGNGYQPDLHEFQITPQGTALITVFDAIDCNLHGVGGGRDAAVADTLLQEIDLKTGLVKFEWHSLDHVALSDSYASARFSSKVVPFDYFHINSIDLERDGDLLVDARNTWTAYDIDPLSGRVRWELDGKHSSFAMGPGTLTAWQHDAREQPDGTITFFDNGATPQVHPESRVIDVRLDPQRMTATLVRAAEHPGKALVSGSQGDLQTLPDGSWLVGWGEEPYITEFGPSGQLLFDAHLPAAYESYRAYRLSWSGHPSEAPALAIVRSGSAATAYVSWNGASSLASWRLLAGPAASALAPVAEAPKSGFETAITVPAAVTGGFLQVQALDASGAVIGASAVRSR